MEYKMLPAHWKPSQPCGTYVPAADLQTMALLMLELRNITLSRASFVAATDFLRRFGGEVDSPLLVQPEAD